MELTKHNNNNPPDVCVGLTYQTAERKTDSWKGKLLLLFLDSVKVDKTKQMTPLSRSSALLNHVDLDKGSEPWLHTKVP
jgi:hypothetical protein